MSRKIDRWTRCRFRWWHKRPARNLKGRDRLLPPRDLRRAAGGE